MGRTTRRRTCGEDQLLPRQRIVVQVHFFSEKPRWTFTFEPADGGTKVTAEGDWTLKVPVVGRPIEGMMVKEHEPFAEELLAGLETQAEVKAAV